MRRQRPSPYATATAPRYIIFWDLQWNVIDCQRLEPRSELRHAMNITITRLQCDGWHAESNAAHGFVFLKRNDERRLLMITARNPDDIDLKFFSPFSRV
jgi:hypothetical protein